LAGTVWSTDTDRATEVARTSIAWWGAAVTTIAPVAPP
jgi:hypothetical protein